MKVVVKKRIKMIESRIRKRGTRVARVSKCKVRQEKRDTGRNSDDELGGDRTKTTVRVFLRYCTLPHRFLLLQER